VRYPVRVTPLFIAIAATIAPAAHADEAAKEGFVEGSSLNLNARNYYMNRNRLQQTDDNIEWGQGFLGIFQSGYTEGTVGFGIDAHAMLGLKLDGGGGTDGSSILPVSDGNGKAPGSFSTAGGTLKMRAFDTELRAGDLFLTNPVIAGGESRMLPQTFRGVSLTNHSFDGWMFEGGQASFTKPYNQSGHQRIGTSYGKLAEGDASQHLNWAGVSWSGVEGLTSNLYAAELKDIWNQYYYDLDYTWQLNDLVSLNPGLHFYHTQDTGDALLGNIDNNTYSLHFTVGIGSHSITAAYQRVNGNTPFDYISQGDSVYLDNSQQYSDFNGPNEKSFQIAYGINMAEYGVPGLKFNIYQARGWGIDGTHYTGTAYTDPGAKRGDLSLMDGESHYEYGIGASYAVQSGPLKATAIRATYTTHRASEHQADGNINEFRLVTTIPFNIL